MSTLALWFELDEVSAHRFSDAISALAEKFRTPRFIPHITVFGGLWIDRASATELVDELLDDVSDVSVEFGEFGYDEIWSRSCYVRVLPSEPMLAIHDRAAKGLGISGPLYAPYLSFLYGEFSRESKAKAIEELQLHLPTHATISAVSLWHTDPTGVEMWRRLYRVPIPTDGLSIQEFDVSLTQ